MVAQTVASRKSKGRRLQNFIAKELLETYNIKLPKFVSPYDGELIVKELVSDDIKPAVMGESGTDIVLSPKAKELIPYDIECKNQETWSLPQWWRQAVNNTGEGRKPLLIIKKNRHEPLVVLRWEDFKELL